jgi:hypothetical protein
MRSQKAREPPVGAGMAQTAFFASAPRILLNRPKPPSRKCSETSCILIGLRRSGLSVPYQAIDCA